MTFTATSGGTPTFNPDFHLVKGLETGDAPAANPNSALDNVLSEGARSTYDFDFSNVVENVPFRVNDVDGDGVVQIKAFDAEGNPITVNLTAGTRLTLIDNDGVVDAETTDRNGGYGSDANPAYSVLVDIPGPVSRIEVVHSQDGPRTSGIKVTDAHYDSFPDVAIGNDTITGGARADTMLGGTGRDTFIIGSAEDGVGDIAHGGTGGDDFDTLDLSGAGRFEIVGETVDPDGDSTSGTLNFLDTDGAITGSMTFRWIKQNIPSFTPGIVIATPKGERLVEDLQIGDRVITRANGLQEIRWTGRRDLQGAELMQEPQLKPVLIRASSLGRGLSERDLLVSPNHRVLINNEKTALYFEDREVLVSAKYLTDLDGVDAVDTGAISYVHFMFDQHEVVPSNGSGPRASSRASRRWAIWAMCSGMRFELSSPNCVTPTRWRPISPRAGRWKNTKRTCWPGSLCNPVGPSERGDHWIPVAGTTSV